MATPKRNPRRRANGDEGSGDAQLVGEHHPDSAPPPTRQIIACRIIHRRDGLAVIVQLEVMDGEPTIDLRLWRRGRAGVQPTARGFRLGLDQANELARALSDIIVADATDAMNEAEADGEGQS